MECLRLHVETQAELYPLVTMTEQSMERKKSSKRSKCTTKSLKEVYEQLVLDYIDRICIWNALKAQTTQGNMYTEFVEPVLQN